MADEIRRANKVMPGRLLAELGFSGDVKTPGHVSVKESVMPFGKFSDVDTLLGPEMKSTGEVMGIAPEFGAACANVIFRKQLTAGPLPWQPASSGSGLI